MDKLKRVLIAVTSSALFWVFFILGAMVLFILHYERPADFGVNNGYHIF